MRQWHVNCKCLCNKHLLGEHVEHHMFRAILVQGKSTAGYIADGLLLPGTLEARHDEIVDEMIRRGMKHSSPFATLETDVFVNAPAFSVKENLRELARRCPDCRMRILNTRFAFLAHGIPEGGDYYKVTDTGAIKVYISGKLVGAADTKARAIVVMERKRKAMRKDGSIWQQ